MQVSPTSRSPCGPSHESADEPLQREQSLVRRDVGRRLLAADVLFAGLQRQYIGAFAVQVGRLADDSPGHPPDELVARGEEAVVRPAEARVVAGALALADRDRAAVGSGRLEDAERHRVDVRDRERAGVVRRRCEVRRGLEHAEEVRLLEDHGSGVLGRGSELVRIGRAAAVRHLDDLEAESGRVRLHDLAHLRVRRLGDDDLRPPGRVLRDEARVGGDRRAVVAGSVRDVHPGQLADRRLVLEDRLQHALAHLGLIRRVRGEELAALKDGVRDRRNVVVVDACAEERELARRVDVSRRELLEMPLQLRLAQRRLEVELPLEAHAGRNVAEQLVDGVDADRREHRLAIGVGQGEVAHELSSSARYAATSRSDSISAGSLRRMRTSQPSP